MVYDARLAERVRTLLATIVEADEAPALSERTMFGGIGFMLGARMCCAVHGDDLIARVPAQDVARATASEHVRPFDLTGRAMSGWYYVAPAGVRTAAALRRWLALGLQIARAAPSPKSRRPSRPRPARRKRPTRAP